MFVNFNILNQLGSPAINSNTFANRPAAGQTGRLFVSTDTFEIYRDNGTTWDLIGGPGSSTITGTGTATQVAYFTSSQAIGSSANLYWDNTAGALGINTATPGAELDVHGTGIMVQLNSTTATANSLLAFQRSGSGLWRIGDVYNGGSNYFEIFNTAGSNTPVRIDASTSNIGLQGAPAAVETLRVVGASTFEDTFTQAVGTDRKGLWSQLTTTTPNAASYTAGMAYTALAAYHLNIVQGSATVPNTVIVGGTSSGALLQFTGGGTLIINQGSTGGLRSFAAVQSQFAFLPTQPFTNVTHVSGFHAYAPYYVGANNPTIDNYYGIALNASTEYTALTITNRWGVYQAGASDLNYFAGNSLFGTTTNVGAKISIAGYMYISNRPLAQIVFNSTGSYYGQIQNDAADKWSFARNFTNDGTLGTPIMTWDAANIRVGINTSSPNSIFEVKSTGTGSKTLVGAFRDSSTNGNGIEIYNQDNLSSIYSTYYSSGSNQDLGFFTTTNTGTQNEVLRLTSTQRVGISTSTPQYKLDITNLGYGVQHYGDVNNSLRTYAGSTYQIIEATNSGTVNQFGYFGGGFFIDTSSTARFRITTGGNVLINTSTNTGQTLQVNGTATASEFNTSEDNFTNVTSGGTATLFTVAASQMYLCYATQGATNKQVTFTVSVPEGGTTAEIGIISTTGASLAITASGLNVQATNTEAFTVTVKTTYIRIKS